ncbi:MAG: transcriptional regulator [Candidatus Bathyarchaeota archaeon B26-2]|nr:MAG: transcriptional regulator [Candidatus Bathyarchaeota archaeon B26-2]
MPQFNSVDIKILEYLGRCGPRNITRIARKLGMHRETVRKRVKRLKSKFFLNFYANPYHTFLGLKKAFIFADAVLGYEETLFKCLEVNDFWIYLGRYYGRGEGCYGIYTVPVDHLSQFENFVEELKKLEITRNVQHFWSTCLHTVNLTERWFDHNSKTWIFPWEEWVNEVQNESTELPYTLKDPEGFPMKFSDAIDLYIIKELEKDATISLNKIASMLNMTPESIHYHYKRHVLENNLIESFQIFLPRFKKEVSDFYVFIFTFDDGDKMARFANSLVDKPFVYSLGKILGKNALVGHLYLPKNEFRGFISSLGQLVRRGLLKTYEYVIEDFSKRKSQTISYEFYRNGMWIYEHEKHIKKLREIAGNAQ